MIKVKYCEICHLEKKKNFYSYSCDMHKAFVIIVTAEIAGHMKHGEKSYLQSKFFLFKTLPECGMKSEIGSHNRKIYTDSNGNHLSCNEFAGSALVKCFLPRSMDLS